MTNARANLLLLLAGAIWGLGFVSQSTAMANIGPFLFIGLRFLIAMVAIVPLALRESRNAGARLTISDVRYFLLIGVFLFAGMSAQQLGLMETSVTNSGFLTGLYVVIVPILSVILFRQWPHPVIWPCAIAALAGIYLLSGGKLEALLPGDWLTILCAIFFALQMLFITRYANRTGRPVALAIVQFSLCAALGFALAIITGERFDWSAVMLSAPEILFVGVFSSGVAFTIQMIGQRYTTAPQAAIFLSSEALFAALFGALLLGERLPPVGLFGCALIFSAMLAVELLPMLWRKRIAA
ncbi:MAG: DMT family transporter [Phyllobacterium sp.]